MNKKICSLVLVLVLTYSSYSQNKFVKDTEKALLAANKDTVLGWKMSGIVMLNFSQTSFTNWSQGGENSIGSNEVFNYLFGFKSNNLSWDNNLNMGYGFMRQGAESRKTDDRIDFTSKLGMTASHKWYYAGLVNFKTQFSPGYNYPDDSTVISNFMAPAYVVAAIGMDYHPNTFFTAFISPLSGRLTIVNDQELADAGSFGVDPAEYINDVKIKDGKKSLKEFGAYIRLLYQKDILTNVNLATKGEAFSNYFEDPQNIAINWELMLTLKVNKFINASVSTQLVYDDKVKTVVDDRIEGPKIQFREVIGVGFSYKF